MFRKSTFALVVLTLGAMAFAQIPGPAVTPVTPANAGAAELQKAAPNSAIGNATSDCSYTFTSGGTTTKAYLQYCVTVNGNITEFQSPAGAEYIRVGVYGEGYGVCDATTETQYYDFADYGDSGNWQAPVLLSQTATIVKIARTTADGIWTLTQTITQNATEANAKVTMALKNNTLAGRSVSLIRWADVDANNDVVNNLDGTTDSAWGYDKSLGRGLMLRRSVPNTYVHNGWARDSNLPPDVCNLDPGWIGTLEGVDGSIVLYHGMTVGKLKTATVTMTYSAF